MIRYALSCQDGHDFDAWFGSAADFERLRTGGHLACSVCGSVGVEKRLMSPRVANRTADARAAHRLAELRREVEATSDYVGRDFAAEARAIHDGTRKRRSIYGEANAADARKLVEDGVPIAPLPFIPKRSTN